MTKKDPTDLELSLAVKHLRFNTIQTALGLGSTLMNLAKVERAIGNPDRAKEAIDDARAAHHKVQTYLSGLDLNREEEHWAAENLNELGQALQSDLLPEESSNVKSPKQINLALLTLPSLR